MKYPRVEFFWDMASPYTYLAATQLDALCGRTGVPVEWRPFLLGGVFKATGNRTPASVTAKAVYMKADLQRWAVRYGVPLNFPALFPMNSILPQRVACAALAQSKAASALPLAMMHAYWVEGRDLSQPEEIVTVCEAQGLDAAALLAQAGEASAKNQLRVNTEEAVERGAFGAPTLFFDGGMFWGNDRLELLEICIRKRLGS